MSVYKVIEVTMNMAEYQRQRLQQPANFSFEPIIRGLKIIFLTEGRFPEKKYCSFRFCPYYLFTFPCFLLNTSLRFFHFRYDQNSSNRKCIRDRVFGKNLLKLFRDMGKCLPQNMHNGTLVPAAGKKESKTSDCAKGHTGFLTVPPPKSVSQITQ